MRAVVCAGDDVVCFDRVAGLERLVADAAVGGGCEGVGSSVAVGACAAVAFTLGVSVSGDGHE